MQLAEHLRALLGLTIFPSLTQLLAAGFVLMGAEAIYVLFGFGMGLIAVGALAMILDRVCDVVVVLLLVNLPAEILVVLASWKAVVWRGVGLVGLGITCGVPLGSMLLQRGNPELVLTALGGLLILVGTVFFGLPRGRKVKWPLWSTPLFGLLSGLLGGMFGTGGPPLILYYQLAGSDKTAFRGNLMAIFLLMGLFRLPTYTVMGLVDGRHLWSAAVLLPMVLLGAVVGNRVHLTFSERTFQRLVALALVLIGLLLLLKL